MLTSKGRHQHAMIVCHDQGTSESGQDNIHPDSFLYLDMDKNLCIWLISISISIFVKEK